MLTGFQITWFVINGTNATTASCILHDKTGANNIFYIYILPIEAQFKAIKKTKEPHP